MEPTHRQSWRDPHGIVRIVSPRPLYRPEIFKILGAKGVPESTIHYNLSAGLKTGGIKYLDDGRIAPPQRERVRWAVLKVMGRKDPASFYSDSSSTPGYGLEMIAHEVGLPPTVIESDFYSLMRELWEKYQEVGKDRFFSLLGWKQVAPAPNSTYVPPD